MSGESRFPSPFEVPTPPGLEGWEKMYPYYYLFSEERREFEESKLWFQDGIHHPEPLYPFDTITCESWWVALSQYTTRVFVIPPALGIDQRVLNGYLYISANAVTDPKEVEQRAQYFMKRSGFYFQNWNDLYAKWERKAGELIKELEAIQVPDLPEIEDERVVTEGRGVSSGYYLLEAFNRILENMHKMWYYHFEMLNLGYVAYLTYFDFCKKAFPGIPDQTCAKMVAGIDILFFRPDDEVKRLAKLALDLKVADVIKQNGNPNRVIENMKKSEAGRKWLEELEQVKHPWFYFSNHYGFYHHHRSWIDDLSIPFASMRGYIDRIERGEMIDRPLKEVLEERERLANEYRALLKTDEDRKSFSDLLNLSRTVFPYIENHNFYVEHWHHTIFWNKMREFGKIFVNHGFFEEVDDIFYLHRYDIYDALYDLITSWAVGTPPRGPKYWPREIRRRKELIEKMKQWTPPPALGPTPEVVTEPFTVMLWGITTERIKEWLAPRPKPEEVTELKGVAGSPGVVEGVARVVMTVDEIGKLETGEILVCPMTSPSWAPVFRKIKAAVSDIGGIMCHAAIVCREYGLPAVVGTGFATKFIQTGQRLRVDGTNGVITILR